MNSYSQAGQDRFVYEILGRKIDGTFLDVGAHDGHKHSNTMGLEELGWRGLLVDIQAFGWHLKRKSDFVMCDAIKADWPRLFDRFFPGQTVIDYLSLDVDDATTATLAKLMALPMRYRVLTVEHDRYRLGPANAEAQRALLAEHGYEIMCKDVRVGPGEWGTGGPFEDYWVCHKLMTQDNFRRFGCDNQLGITIVPDES